LPPSADKKCLVEHSAAQLLRLSAFIDVIGYRFDKKNRQRPSTKSVRE